MFEDPEALQQVKILVVFWHASDPELPSSKLKPAFETLIASYVDCRHQSVKSPSPCYCVETSQWSICRNTVRIKPRLGVIKTCYTILILILMVIILLWRHGMHGEFDVASLAQICSIILPQECFCPQCPIITKLPLWPSSKRCIPSFKLQKSKSAITACCDWFLNLSLAWFFWYRKPHHGQHAWSLDQHQVRLE